MVQSYSSVSHWNNVPMGYGAAEGVVEAGDGATPDVAVDEEVLSCFFRVTPMIMAWVMDMMCMCPCIGSM